MKHLDIASLENRRPKLELDNAFRLQVIVRIR